MTQRAKDKTKNIAFRLPIHLASRLEERASQENGTVSDFVRSIVVKALAGEDEQGERVVKELGHVHENLLSALESMNEKLARLAVILLTDAGNAELDEAEAWVDEFLRHKKSATREHNQHVDS